MLRSNLFLKREAKLFKICLHLLFSFRILYGSFSICLCIDIGNNNCLYFHHFEITASFIQTLQKKYIVLLVGCSQLLGHYFPVNAVMLTGQL